MMYYYYRIEDYTKHTVNKLEQVGKYLWCKVHDVVKACEVRIVYNSKQTGYQQQK